MDAELKNLLIDNISPNNMDEVIGKIKIYCNNKIIGLKSFYSKTKSKTEQQKEDHINKLNMILERKQIMYHGLSYYTPDNINVYNYKDENIGTIMNDSISFNNKEAVIKHNTNKSILSRVNNNKILYI